MQTKKELRRQMRAVRHSVTPEEHRILDQKIVRQFLSSAVFQEASIILGYLSCQDEASVDGILEAALQSGKEVYVPRCLDTDGKMAFYRLRSLEEVQTGMYGIREPNPNTQLLTETSSMVCLVPGLAFDDLGYRVGYGKGYYDRFLSKSRAISVGICYNQCKVCQVPRGEYDLPVQFLCTESGMMQTR